MFGDLHRPSETSSKRMADEWILPCDQHSGRSQRLLVLWTHDSGSAKAWVEVSGGSLSQRLPAAGWRGSLMACAPPGTVTR